MNLGTGYADYTSPGFCREPSRGWTAPPAIISSRRRCFVRQFFPRTKRCRGNEAVQARLPFRGPKSHPAAPSATPRSSGSSARVPAGRLRLIILDACRDNPFANRMKRSIASRSVARGLAKVEPTSPNTLIAFAAKAGSTAADGDSANSPFAAALVKYLRRPSLDVRRAFGFQPGERCRRHAHQP